MSENGLETGVSTSEGDGQRSHRRSRRLRWLAAALELSASSGLGLAAAAFHWASRDILAVFFMFWVAPVLLLTLALLLLGVVLHRWVCREPAFHVGWIALVVAGGYGLGALLLSAVQHSQ